MSNLVQGRRFDDRATRRPVGWLILAVPLAAALLAGCTEGGTAEDRTGRFLVSPGKYDLWPCPQMGDRAVEVSTRQTELEVLMAKAGPGAGGTFVSAVGYRPEYLQMRGEMTELRKAAAAKNCDLAKAIATTREADALRQRDADEARAKARQNARMAPKPAPVR